MIKREEWNSKEYYIQDFEPSELFYETWEVFVDGCDYGSLNDLLDEFYPDGLTSDEFEEYITDNLCHVFEMCGGDFDSYYYRFMWVELKKKVIELGGCDASDEWSRGYDSAIDLVLRTMSEMEQC